MRYSAVRESVVILEESAVCISVFACKVLGRAVYAFHRKKDQMALRCDHVCLSIVCDKQVIESRCKAFHAWRCANTWQSKVSFETRRRDLRLVPRMVRHLDVHKHLGL